MKVEYKSLIKSTKLIYYPRVQRKITNAMCKNICSPVYLVLGTYKSINPEHTVCQAYSEGLTIFYPLPLSKSGAQTFFTLTGYGKYDELSLP